MYQVIAQAVGKEYRLYARPVDRLIEAITHRPRHVKHKVLANVSFQLSKGECLGVIGKNGAGKSTLLKILAGTLSPTTGTIQVKGRVAALLELGAGFHQEFTGRENIYLNASLMGLSSNEIAQREQEIISFSELEDFIDRPIRTYSSGMYIRLAFAIATSVDPNVLIIDEALAVGDVSFQLKCIERMSQFRDRGATMVFCSHSMYHIRELCDKVLWLDNGIVKKMGPSEEVTNEYEAFCMTKKQEPVMEKHDDHVPIQEKECMILSLSMHTPQGDTVDEINPCMDLVLKMRVRVLKDNVKPRFGFAIVGGDDTILATALTHHDRVECGPYRAGDEVEVSLVVKEIPLREGVFRITGGVAEERGLLWYETKNLWPVKVKGDEEGFGPLGLKKEWEIRKI